ncbi:MAG: DUF4430 domain-containing protein [Candidatus Faecousia sp.]|nr:DUF4430 domain-containing protein [Candidatus Faecousia sp.]
MKNKKLWIAVAALVALVAVMAGVYLAFRPQTTAGEKQISVTVVHADGSEKQFQYQTREEYLGSVLLAEGLVEGENGPYGLTIYVVDGERADWNENQSYWALYIGDEYATTGADSTPVQDGDSFRLVYTVD